MSSSPAKTLPLARRLRRHDRPGRPPPEARQVPRRRLHNEATLTDEEEDATTAAGIDDDYNGEGDGTEEDRDDDDTQTETEDDNDVRPDAVRDVRLDAEVRAGSSPTPRDDQWSLNPRLARASSRRTSTTTAPTPPKTTTTTRRRRSAARDEARSMVHNTLRSMRLKVMNMFDPWWQTAQEFRASHGHGLRNATDAQADDDDGPAAWPRRHENDDGDEPQSAPDLHPLPARTDARPTHHPTTTDTHKQTITHFLRQAPPPHDSSLLSLRG